VVPASAMGGWFDFSEFALASKQMQGTQDGNQDGANTGPALLQKLVGDVRLLVFGPRWPNDAEFDAHVVEAAAMSRSTRVVLVMNPWELSADRRKKLAQADLLESPTAVLTDSIRIRGMLTPINWLGGKVYPFATNEFAKACDYLEVAAEARPALYREMMSMMAELASSRTVSPAADAAPSFFGSALETVKRAFLAWVTTSRKKGDAKRPDES
jgi:hypothetical protein